jgi:hypothetical protein
MAGTARAIAILFAGIGGLVVGSLLGAFAGVLLDEWLLSTQAGPDTPALTYTYASGAVGAILGFAGGVIWMATRLRASAER